MGKHTPALLAAPDTANANVDELGQVSTELFPTHPDDEIITNPMGGPTPDQHRSPPPTSRPAAPSDRPPPPTHSWSTNFSASSTTAHNTSRRSPE